MRAPGRDTAESPASPTGRLAAHLRLGIPFYLGLRALATRQTYPECCVRAAAGRTPELVRALLTLYRGDDTAGAGSVEQINFRCAALTLGDTGERFFFKEFPRHHLLHDVERALRCSRVDRAWRAAHVLPHLRVLTPRAVGTVIARADHGPAVEYLATEWLDGAIPFPDYVRQSEQRANARLPLLREFAGNLRHWHAQGVYLRDLVKNVLVREEARARSYWLTDLDGLHPYRWLTRSRILRHMRQLAHWVGPLHPEEAIAICRNYLGEMECRFAHEIVQALTIRRPEADSPRDAD